MALIAFCKFQSLNTPSRASYLFYTACTWTCKKLASIDLNILHLSSRSTAGDSQGYLRKFDLRQHGEYFLRPA